LRGLKKVTMQAMLVFAAMNLKKLATRLWRSGQPGDSHGWYCFIFMRRYIRKHKKLPRRPMRWVARGSLSSVWTARDMRTVVCMECGHGPFSHGTRNLLRLSSATASTKPGRWGPTTASSTGSVPQLDKALGFRTCGDHTYIPRDPARLFLRGEVSACQPTGVVRFHQPTTKAPRRADSMPAYRRRIHGVRGISPTCHMWFPPLATNAPELSV